MADGDMAVVDLAGEPVTVLWRHSARARRLQIRVRPECLVVVMPARGSVAEAERFLHSHARWALRHMQRLRSARERIPRVHDGALLPFRGGQLRLSIRRTTDSIDSVLLQGDRLTVACRAPDERQAILAPLERWYWHQAKVQVEGLLSHWVPCLQVRPTAVCLRNLSSRWGSCSPRGSVSLNWRLILAPDEVFGYVVVHELCHLRRLGHGAAFWALLREAMPEADDARRWLRENQEWMMGFLREELP